MNILVSQHLPDLPIAQRRLILPHLPRNLRIRTLLCQELLRCHPLDRNRIVGSIEDLESQPALFDRQVTDLSQVSGIDITPRISFTRSGIGEIRREIFRILVWFDNISNSKSVDVVFKASGEGSCCFLTADLGKCVSGRLSVGEVM
jgi:hypothetical protein